MANKETAQPDIRWDGKTWFVTLPMEDGKILEAKWDSDVTYIVRIREDGTDRWSYGFETPVPGCTFTGLEPGIEYEIEVRSKNSQGESAPTCHKFRTDRKADPTNVIPFPKR